MDFNIASAFWFASSGKGWLYDPPPREQLLPSLPQQDGFCGNVGGVGVGGDRVGGVVGGSGVGSDSVDGVGGNCVVSGGGGGDDGSGGGGEEEINGPNVEARGALAGKVSVTNGLPSTPVPDVPLTKSGLSSAEPTHSFAAMTIASEGRGGITRPPPASASSGDRVGEGDLRGTDKGKVANRAKKVNKNMDELCPVEGCRRLLKPGCVFGVCSRCCLKAQGLIDVAASTTGASPSERMPPPAAVVAATAAAAAAATAAGAAGAAAAAVVSESEAQRLLCKTRALEEASQALKVHLTEHFADLSEPFQAKELAALLLKRGDSTCQVRPGRNVHFQALALASGALQSAKWCPVHKRRSRGGQGGGGGDRHATAASLKSGVEAGGLEKRSMSAASFTSNARVLLVRGQPGRVSRAMPPVCRLPVVINHLGTG